MVRKFWLLVGLAVFAYVGFLSIQHYEEFVESLFSYAENRDLVTLEARFSPEEILSFHNTVYGTKEENVKKPTLRFFPYLFMDVKYRESGKTKEDAILWSLYDGEMVLDADTWETTHGFADCLKAKATRSDFLLLEILSKYPQERASIDQLQRDLHVDKKTCHQKIAKLVHKHLIVQLGPTLQLHFENPLIFVSPKTKFPHSFVTKPYAHEQKMVKNFRHKHIQKIAEAAFGETFAIRDQYEVYVPVYVIESKGKNGSISTSYWNAFSGNPFKVKMTS